MKAAVMVAFFTYFSSIFHRSYGGKHESFQLKKLQIPAKQAETVIYLPEDNSYKKT